MQDTFGNFCAEPTRARRARDPVDRPCDPGAFRAAGSPAHDPLRARWPARTASLNCSRHRPHPGGPGHGSERTPLRLGNVYLDTLELRSKAIPWAEDLARRTGYSVRTGVLLLDDVVIIHHEPRPDGSRQMPEVCIVIPAHASALCKAILAFDDEAASRMLAAATLRSMTGETITSPSDLKEQLADICSTGLAREQEEAVLGECAIAAPVFDVSGAPVGAIELVVPSTNWPVDPATSDAVNNALSRLTSEEPTGMGRMFKAIGFGHPKLGELPGFEGVKANGQVEHGRLFEALRRR